MFLLSWEQMCKCGLDGKVEFKGAEVSVSEHRRQGNAVCKKQKRSIEINKLDGGARRAMRSCLYCKLQVKVASDI